MIGWIAAKLAPLSLFALAAALSLAGVQTVRFHQKTTELAEFKASKIAADLSREWEFTSSVLRARATEQRLNDQSNTIREESHAALQTLDGRVAVLLGQLRTARADRPRTANGQPAPPASTAAGCTGAGLYRPDGEFLVGFAASAARTGIERDACRAQYSAAREALSP